MAGPTARATLVPTLLKAMAAGNSPAGTSSGVRADQAGIISAVPMPMARVNSSNRGTVIRPLRVRNARSMATLAIQPCTSSR